jgi:predicted RNA-binding Zn-ribbon protein involved in translation (DUF1610 family)
MRWVNCDPLCILCKVYGEPQNESAVKMSKYCPECGAKMITRRHEDA